MENENLSGAMTEVIGNADAAGQGAGVDALALELYGNMDEPATVDANEDGDNARQEKTEARNDDKFDRRIKAALKNQESKFLRDIGVDGDMTLADVREMVMAHKAQKLSKEDPEISEKAARRIIEAEERTRSGGEPDAADVQTYRDALDGLIEDGWTADELRELVADSTVLEDLQDGKTLRQAARAYEKRNRAGEKPKEERRRSAVPVSRAASAGEVPTDDPYEDMSDAEFRRHAARVREQLLAGHKVRR